MASVWEGSVAAACITLPRKEGHQQFEMVNMNTQQSLPNFTMTPLHRHRPQSCTEWIKFQTPISFVGRVLLQRYHEWIVVKGNGAMILESLLLPQTSSKSNNNNNIINRNYKSKATVLFCTNSVQLEEMSTHLYFIVMEFIYECVHITLVPFSMIGLYFSHLSSISV